MTKDTINFDASARLLKILGGFMIKDHTTGIMELIKNGFDADAKNVIVTVRNPTQPSQTQARQSIVELPAFAAAFSHACSRMSSTVCRLKAENVVKPPQNPDIRNIALVLLRCSSMKKPAQTPIMKAPRMLAASVAQGNPSCRANQSPRP